MTKSSYEIKVPPTNTHPFLVRLRVLLGSNIQLEAFSEEVEYAFPEDLVIKVLPQGGTPKEEASSLNWIRVDLIGFQSQEAAVAAGKKIATSLLFFAVSKRVSLALQPIGTDNFEVIKRGSSPGIQVKGNVSVYHQTTTQELTEIASACYDKNPELPTNVLRSLEFYASAGLESSQQAQFINLMTALEALCEQEALPEKIQELVTKIQKMVTGSEVFDDAECSQLKDSFRDRIKHLKTESIRQAMIRTVKKYTDNDNAKKTIDDIYGLRSALLHEGIRIDNLEKCRVALDDILRTVYSKIIELPLDRGLYEAD